MHPAFARLDHRPWPLPASPWVWRQAWLDLLFAHWPVPTAAVRQLVPEVLEIDCFEGQTYVGLVPFRMSGVMRRPLPDLPWISAFPEVNVRVYVRYQGKPGVYFLSLDAPNPLAVWTARRFFHLPYYRSNITFTQSEQSIQYHSQRLADGPSFQGSYAPTGPTYEAAPGSLEHWLTERYCLYALSPRNHLFCCDVHHLPWPLQPARAQVDVSSLVSVHALGAEGPPPLLHFARGVDVVMWAPVRVA